MVEMGMKKASPRVTDELDEVCVVLLLLSEPNARDFVDVREGLQHRTPCHGRCHTT